MAANRLSGQARREARCGAIGRASQRTWGADWPHRRPGSFAPWRCCPSSPMCRIAIKSAPSHGAKEFRSNGFILSDHALEQIAAGLGNFSARRPALTMAGRNHTFDRRPFEFCGVWAVAPGHLCPLLSALGPMINELNERSREIFRHIVDSYVETGEPIGSATLANRLGQTLSPASVRNVMAELESAGLLYSPHTSAGRVPTDAGLRFFVDGLLEIGDLTEDEQGAIEARCAAVGRSLPDTLKEASDMLSGLSMCAGVVMAPKVDSRVKHIEMVGLAPGRALVILVTEDGIVENRVADIPTDMPQSGLIEASNYLDSRLAGRTFAEARDEITTEITQHTAELDDLTARVVEAGLATWAGGQGPSALIVRGQAKLLNDVNAVEDLERIRKLFDALEAEQDILRMLDLADGAEGVRIYIGSENQLFEMTGSAMVVAPYSNSRADIVGAIGIIGPTRLNYARIIPMVDYTAKVVGRLVG